MIRILAFCDYFQPPMGGGAEIVSAEVYERLAKSEQFDITVITGVPGWSRGESTAEAAVKVERRWAFDLSRFVGGQFSLSPGVLFSTWRQMRRHRPDVIHASSIHFVGSSVGAIASFLWKVPLVTTCHLSGLDALPPRTRFLASLYERIFGRFILRRSASVIAVSGAVRDHLLSSGTEPGRVTVVENGVDTDRFRPGDEGPGEESSGTGPRVAFVGRLIANKAPLELLEAVTGLEDSPWQLDMVGDGPLLDEVEKIAARDERVHVLGHRTDVEHILGEADVFVRTSTTEGRSLAILEAMAAGCAVVASDIPANAEMICDGINGLLVPPGDTPALTRALRSLLADRELRERLGRAAREDALAVSWETTAEATGAILVAAAAGAP